MCSILVALMIQQNLLKKIWISWFLHCSRGIGFYTGLRGGGDILALCCIISFCSFPGGISIPKIMKAGKQHYHRWSVGSIKSSSKLLHNIFTTVYKHKHVKESKVSGYIPVCVRSRTIPEKKGIKLILSPPLLTHSLLFLEIFVSLCVCIYSIIIYKQYIYIYLYYFMHNILYYSIITTNF